MVLWYFHVKYAVMNMDEGYELQSLYDDCPERLGGGWVDATLKLILREG